MEEHIDIRYSIACSCSVKVFFLSTACNKRRMRREKKHNEQLNVQLNEHNMPATNLKICIYSIAMRHYVYLLQCSGHVLCSIQFSVVSKLKQIHVKSFR